MVPNDYLEGTMPKISEVLNEKISVLQLFIVKITQIKVTIYYNFKIWFTRDVKVTPHDDDFVVPISDPPKKIQHASYS